MLILFAVSNTQIMQAEKFGEEKVQYVQYDIVLYTVYMALGITWVH